LKKRWKLYLGSIAIPLAVGGLAALLTRNGMEQFEMIEKPPLTPPGWVFPVAWTILYILMGIAAAQVRESDAAPAEKRCALTFYGAQLAANFLWSIIFFGFRAYIVAFVWLIVLWGLIFVTWRKFRNIRPSAGWLLVPYLAWVTFAGYLNLGVAWLN